MNREIKFREWCKEINQMFYEPYMHEEVSIEEHFNDCGRVFMQYTGLKDKNGKEIYEGDIVKTCFPYTETNAEVVFNNGQFYPNSDCQTIYSRYWNKDCEVIGNIYEDKDLLE